MRAATILVLSYRIDFGTPPKNANARTWPSPKPPEDPVRCMLLFLGARLVVPENAVVTTKFLFDDFIGCVDKLIGNCEAERFRGFQIDYQLEFARQLNGQVLRFGTFQYAVNV